MIVRDGDRSFLEKYISNYSQYIENEEIDELLREINIVILSQGLDEHDEITDFGRLAQRVYDNIFYDNE